MVIMLVYPDSSKVRGFWQRQPRRTNIPTFNRFLPNIGGIFAQSHNVVICLFVIWLLHCNAMHFDSFSFGARHLFQKLMLFFLCEVIYTE
jgi:hypothetical protein